jgi:pseudoazurin
VVKPASEKLGTRRSAAMAAVAVVSVLGLQRAGAAEHEIHTRANEWVPAVLFVDSGDTVIWRGMSGHETESIEDMVPAGAMPWRSKLGEEGFKVMFAEEGAYLYRCNTHLKAGMVGAIVVGRGEPRNLAAIETALSRMEAGRAFAERVVARLKRELHLRSGR